MNGLSQLACHRLISPYFQANFNIYLPTFSYKIYRIICPRTIRCALTERTDGKMKKLTFEHQNNSFVVFELGLVPVFLLISHIQFQYFDFFFVLAFFLFISVQFFFSKILNLTHGHFSSHSSLFSLSGRPARDLKLSKLGRNQ